MASTMTSLGEVDETAMDSKTTTTGKLMDSENQDLEIGNEGMRWRSVTEQRTYSSKLAQALRKTSSSDPPSNAYTRTRAVRETADRVLAAAAKGRTRWSRAILTRRLSLRKNHRKMKLKPNPSTESKDRRKMGEVARRRKQLPVLQRRVRDLGRLIPGCRRLPLPNLLEETTDYIAALKMQVTAMAALADLLAGVGVASGGGVHNQRS